MKISNVARLAAIRALGRLYKDCVEVYDYGSGGEMLCETILESEIQNAINEATAEKDAEIERLREALAEIELARQAMEAVRNRHGCGGDNHVRPSEEDVQYCKCKIREISEC